MASTVWVVLSGSKSGLGGSWVAFRGACFGRMEVQESGGVVFDVGLGGLVSHRAGSFDGPCPVACG